MNTKYIRTADTHHHRGISAVSGQYSGSSIFKNLLLVSNNKHPSIASVAECY
jgi:hypothetical protein